MLIARQSMQRRCWRLVARALVLIVLIETLIIPNYLISPVQAKRSKKIESIKRALDNMDVIMLKLELAGWALRYPDLAVTLALTGAKYKYMSDVDLYSKYDLAHDAKIVLQMAQRNPQAVRELLAILGDAVHRAYETHLTEAEKEKLQALLEGEQLLPTIAEGDNAIIKTVKFYEGGNAGVPTGARHYQNSFPLTKVRYVYTEIMYKNKNYQKQDAAIPYSIKYYDSNNQFLIENKGIAEPKAEWSSCLLAAGGIGFDQPGQWPAGRYTAKIWLDNVYVGEYPFQIIAQ